MGGWVPLEDVGRAYNVEVSGSGIGGEFGKEFWRRERAGRGGTGLIARGCLAQGADQNNNGTSNSISPPPLPLRSPLAVWERRDQRGSLTGIRERLCWECMF